MTLHAYRYYQYDRYDQYPVLTEFLDTVRGGGDGEIVSTSQEVSTEAPFLLHGPGRGG